MNRNLQQWEQYIEQQHSQAIDMGLSRMHQMIGRLQLARPAPYVITVAGTNGKGSTCILSESLLRANNLRVGTTVSPHIERLNERIRIDGQPIDDSLFCRCLAAVEACREDLPLTYFEFVALAALWCFRQASVDVAILEIGLGGRLDAFNAIDADVAVITSIGLDHQEYLGDTLEQIGREKAGILRSRQAVVLGEGLPDSVAQACADLSIVPRALNADFSIRYDADHVEYRGSDRLAQQLVRWTPGSLPAENMALAIEAVANVIREPLRGIVRVAEQTTLDGRLQRMEYHGRELYLDIAHNPHAAQFLVGQLQRKGIHPELAVCAMLKGKDFRGVLDTLRPHVEDWLVIDTLGFRAMSGAVLYEYLQEQGAKVHYLENAGQVLNEIDSATQPGDAILAFGSFSIVQQLSDEAKTIDSDSRRQWDAD